MCTNYLSEMWSRSGPVSYHFLSIGEILPVDGVLFRSNNMSADESSITGETNLVRKFVPETYEPGEKKIPFLISGSKVMEGTGDMIVLAVGDNSQWGQAKRLMKSGKQTKTPLQEKLNDLADDIGKIGFRVNCSVTSVDGLPHFWGYDFAPCAGEFVLRR